MYTLKCTALAEVGQGIPHRGARVAMPRGDPAKISLHCGPKKSRFGGEPLLLFSHQGGVVQEEEPYDVCNYRR